MMSMQIIGNLGSDAELKANGSYKPFTSFPIAVTDRYRNADGIFVDRTIWVHCNINFPCDNLRPYLVKGTKVWVIGSVKLRTYKDRSGSIAAGLDMFVDHLELCGSRSERADGAVNSRVIEPSAEHLQQSLADKVSPDELPF